MMDSTTKLVIFLTNRFYGITPSKVTDGFGAAPSETNKFLYNDFLKAFSGLVYTATEKYQFILQKNGDDWELNLYPV